MSCAWRAASAWEAPRRVSPGQAACTWGPQDDFRGAGCLAADASMQAPSPRHPTCNPACGSTTCRSLANPTRHQADAEKERICKRFWTALILTDIIAEVGCGVQGAARVWGAVRGQLGGTPLPQSCNSPTHPPTRRGQVDGEVVARKFQVRRGDVQDLQDRAARNASMTAAFCERLGWHDLEALVVKFQVGV